MEGFGFLLALSLGQMGNGGCGVGRGDEEGVGGTVFDDGALAHDGDVVGDVANYGEIVRDEDHGE